MTTPAGPLKTWRGMLERARAARSAAIDAPASEKEGLVRQACRLEEHARAFHSVNLFMIEREEQAEQASGRDAEAKAERARFADLAKHGGPELAEYERLRQENPTRAAIYAQLEPMALHAQREKYTAFLVDRAEADKQGRPDDFADPIP